MLKPSYSKKYLSPSKLKWLVFFKINIETKKMSRIKLSQLETIFNHALQRLRLSCFLVHNKYINRGWAYTRQKTDRSASIRLLQK